MYIISKIDYRKYKNLYKIAYIGSVLLLALVPIIGTEVNGAKRWIDLKFTQFQPSEVAKIGLIVFYAAYLTNNREKLKTTWGGFWKPILLLSIPIVILVVFQDHLSASIVIIAIIAVMMLIAGTRIRDFLTSGLGMAGFGAGALVLMSQLTGKGSFRFDRIISFLNPWADPTGDRMASNTKLICNWVWWIIWSRIADKVSKNIYTYHFHIMTSFFLY